MVKVSVILPVYNPGQGIVKCLHTLTNQTLQDIEMIFVDDCGTDSSMELIKAEAEKDSRIRCLHNIQNMGAGPSRNRGIEEARGEYLSFVDPDDYIALDFLELLYAKAKESGASIVKGECQNIDEHGRTIKAKTRYLPNDHIRKGLEKGDPLCNLFTYNHWTAIFKREWIMHSGARYGTSRNSQDTTFLLQVCFGNPMIAFEDRAIYFYVARKGSRVHDYSPERLQYQLDAWREQTDFLNSSCADEKLACARQSKELYLLLRVQAAFAVQASWDKSPEKTMAAEAFLQQLLQMAWKLPYACKIAARNKILEAFMIFGVNLTHEPYPKNRKVPFTEYLDAIRRITDFICAHSETGPDYKVDLRNAIEEAILEKSWKNEQNLTRQEAFRLLRQEADRLPDKGILTDGSFAMRVFLRSGISLFGCRNIFINAWSRPILRRLRKKNAHLGKPKSAQRWQPPQESAEIVYSSAHRESIPKVSVIIPVYNSEATIERCIHSLQNQTLQDIEMIFVNDCGTDASADIIREAALKDNRIRILFNEKKSGPGFSRNQGIKAASGEYLSFVDSDDYVEERFLELLYERANAVHADIVKGTVIHEGGDSSPRQSSFNQKIRMGIGRGDDFCFLFTTEHFSAIYRRTWVMNSGAFYGASGNGEDTTFLLRVCYGIRSFLFADKAYYHYVHREGSATTSFSPERLENQLISLREKTEFVVSYLKQRPGVLTYMSKMILWNLKIHAGYMVRGGTKERGDAFLRGIQECARLLPFLEDLYSYRAIKVLMKYDMNIIPDWFESETGMESFADVLNVVQRMVDFICVHPELGWEYSKALSEVFEKVILYSSQHRKGQPEKREIRKLLCEQADRLPDRRFLTGESICMKLYMDYKIDLFRFRKTFLWKQMKRVLQKIAPRKS